MIEGNLVLPAEPLLIRLPHTKGSTPDREKPPTESELSESDYVFEESEEEGEVREEGDGDGFTGLSAQRSDSESETEYRGREEWHGSSKAEAKVWRKELSTSHPMGRGKRKARAR